MSGNRWVRQTHRWVSTAFTLTVIANNAQPGLLNRLWRRRSAVVVEHHQPLIVATGSTSP